MVNFGGWDLPQQYSSVREEHLAVRRAAGLFDISHMGRIEVRGPGAAAYLAALLTNEVERLGLNHAQYTLMCADDGGILDDLVAYRHGVDRYTLVVNASNRLRDLDWMRARLLPGVDLEDITASVSLVALQGPLAQSALPATGVDLDTIPYFGFAGGQLAGVPATISRTGYTGEDGFELFVATEQVVRVWDALLESDRVLAAGLAARDVCRLEAGLRLYGNEMDETTNPYEAGLGWTVKLQGRNFAGRDALAAARERGARREIVGIACDGRVIPRHGAAVSVGGRMVGTVTSGTHSFFLGRGIAMATVERGVVQPGSSVELDVRGIAAPAEVVRLPFIRGSARTGVAPLSSRRGDG